MSHVRDLEHTGRRYHLINMYILNAPTVGDRTIDASLQLEGGAEGSPMFSRLIRYRSILLFCYTPKWCNHAQIRANVDSSLTFQAAF